MPFTIQSAQVLITLDIVFGKCYLSKNTWLSFLQIQVPSYQCPSYTHVLCQDENWEVTSLPIGIQYGPAEYIFISSRVRMAEEGRRSKLNDQLQELHDSTKQRSTANLCQCIIMHTGKPFKYQSIIKSWPVPFHAFFTHLSFPPYLWYIPAKPSFSPNNSLGTPSLHPTSTHFFLPSTHKIPFLSLIVNPASPTKNTSPQLLLNPPIFPGIKSTVALLDMSKFNKNCQKF